MKKFVKSILTIPIYIIFLIISINTFFGKDIWDKLQKWRNK